MAYNTIKLKKYSDVIEEFVAHAAITPGMLLELNSDGEVLAHDTVSGIVAPPMFALEDELQGKDIDDAYVAGDAVQVWIPGRGDQVYAILNDGQNVAKGDFLVSSGEGYLNKLTIGSAGTTEYPHAIVAVSLETKDLSDSSLADSGLGLESSIAPLGYNRRIRVRIV